MAPARRSRPDRHPAAHVPGAACLLGLLKLVCGPQPQVGRVGLVFGGPGPSKKRSRSFPVIALAWHCPHHVLILCARRQNPPDSVLVPLRDDPPDTSADLGFDHGLQRLNGAMLARLGAARGVSVGGATAAARLPLPGEPLAIVQHGLRALEMKGQAQPLACEIGEDARVLRVLGRFGEFLTPRPVRTTFFRVPGHGARPACRRRKKSPFGVKKRV